MRLSDINDEMTIRDAWVKLEQALEETIILDEGEESRLNKLVIEADKVLLPVFGIDASEKKYFIAGSSRLYLYPGLPEFINEITNEFGGAEVPLEPGDLDVVIPNKDNWDKLESNLNGKFDKDKYQPNLSNFIYRPQELGITKMDIEAFDVWAPNRAGGEYASTEVDDTNVILNRASEYNGFYYMSIQDVLAYKTQMTRDKEKRIAELINTFTDRRSKRTKEQLFDIIARIVRINTSKDK
tara:strand:+ start:460 stop:1179 length:720 start_codon:yes stop_codon:yes gene_type:complete